MALSRLFKEDRLVIRENQSFRYLCLVISLSVCLSLSETKLTANVLKKIFFKRAYAMQCTGAYTGWWDSILYRSFLTFSRFELSIYLPVYLSVYLPTNLSLYLHTYLPTYTYLIIYPPTPPTPLPYSRRHALPATWKSFFAPCSTGPMDLFVGGQQPFQKRAVPGNVFASSFQIMGTKFLGRYWPTAGLDGGSGGSGTDTPPPQHTHTLTLFKNIFLTPPF